jgi:hypothetical protein
MDVEGVGTLKLDHLATAGTYQVLVFFPWLHFIVATLGSQAEFFD